MIDAKTIFSKMRRMSEIRRWLAKWAGQADIYLIVALATVHDKESARAIGFLNEFVEREGTTGVDYRASGASGTGMEMTNPNVVSPGPGETLVAIEYQKLRFGSLASRLWSPKVENAVLEKRRHILTRHFGPEDKKSVLCPI